MPEESTSISTAPAAGLPGVATLLRLTWDRYVAHWQLWAIIVLPVAIVSALYEYALSAGILVEKSPALFFAGLIFLLVYLLSLLALIVAIREPSGVADAYRKGVGLFLPYLWIVLLMSLAIMGALLLGAVVLFVVFSVLGISSELLQVLTVPSTPLGVLSSDVILALIATFLILMVSAVAVSIWLGFAPFILVSESRRGIKALRSSVAYIRGSFWRVLGRHIVLFVLSILVAVGGYYFVSFGFSFVGTFLTNLLFLPFAMLYFYGIYEGLRMEKRDLI